MIDFLISYVSPNPLLKMANVLLTYDIIRKNDEIHNKLKELLIDDYGFEDRIEAANKNNKIYELPSTTLIKKGENVTRKGVSVEFERACEAVGARWQKYIAVEYAGATFDNQPAPK